MIALIGSGPHNLAAVTFLLQANPALKSEIVVFDPSGRWLSRWNAQLESQEIPHLRSSSVHHPDPDPLALRRFAKGRFDEFFPPYYLPGTQLFREFCEDVVERFDLQGMIRAQRVERLEPSIRGFRLFLDDGSVVDVHAVIAALGGGDPVWPSWAPAPEAPTLVHAEQVHLKDLPEEPGHVVIVGGGLTSGHLAVGALKRGWQVDLVTRRPVRYKLFDSAPGWIGPKYMTGFRRQQDWKRRRLMISRARGGGAMTEEVREWLEPYRKRGQLVFRPRCQVQRVSRTERGWKLHCGWGRTLEAERVWLGTGTKLDLKDHPLFKGLWEKNPLQMVEGLPVLDADCSWPGLPLYLMGMPTALRIGPTARNFPGSRYAASKIAAALTGVVVSPH